MTAASPSQTHPLSAPINARWAIGTFIAFTLLLGSFYGYLYTANGGQATLVVTAACVLAAVVAGIGLNRAQSSGPGDLVTAFLGLGGIALLFLGIEAGINGYTWINAGLGAALLIAFSVLLFGRRYWLGLFALTFFGLLMLGLAQTRPLPSVSLVDLITRIDPQPGFTSLRMLLVQYTIPLVAGSILIFWMLGAIYQRVQGAIRGRLMFSFVVLVILTASIVIGVFAVISLVYGERTVITQLELINTARQAEINNWTTRLTSTLSVQVENVDVERRIQTLLLQTETAGSEEYLTIQSILRGDFRRTIQSSQLYDEIYLLDTDGKVITTTRTGEDNPAARKLEWELLQPGFQRMFFTPLFTFEGTNNVLASVQIFSPTGSPIGVLVGRARMSRLTEILENREGLGTTGEIYLVDNGHRMRTPSRFEPWRLLVGLPLKTRGADSVSPNANGSDSYFGYRGIPVLGVQHWLPDLKVALLTEQDQIEAFSTVYIALANSALAALAVILLAVFASAITTRSIATPLAQLADTATLIAQGDLDLTTGLERQDEIGDLARAFDRMTEQLRDLITDLEGRVNERTRALERRAVQIQAASQIARDVSAFNNLDELLGRAVDLIRDRFGFYHAGIFLADERDEFAVLQAATGEAGAEMLARGHKLKVGEVGIVGYVVDSGQPRIALDVGSDQTHFRNPLLPRTRSEMALPLRAGDHVIGALDVQSELPSAFTEEDIQILQTMADQLAMAIENTRLLERLQGSVVELESTYQQSTRAAWQEFLQASNRVYAYRYRDAHVEPVQETSPETEKALQTGKLALTAVHETETDRGYTTLAVPITLRSHILGALTLRFSGEGISQEIIELIENASGRLAIALENARLLEEIQMRSEREHMVGEISSKIRASTNIDGILRTAVTELGRAMGVSEVLIQLQGEE